MEGNIVAAVEVSAPPVTEVSQSTSNPIKPVRQNYYKLTVLSSDGSVVNEADWKVMVGDLSVKEAKKVLRKHGWQFARVFMRTKYYEDRKAYKDALKSSAVADQSQLIADAFSKAECLPEPHVTRALKAIAPLLKGAPTSKLVTSLKNVIRVVDTASGHKLQAAHPSAETTGATA